ncbi:MAG: hypothetical protein AAFW87_04070 [Pseudomonadota bacterium]
MSRHNQGSIAAFGYRQPPAADFPDIVHAIDALLQKTDAQPRQLQWFGKNIAIIDRVGVRIALGILPPSDSDRYTHLLIAVGERPDDVEDDLLTMSNYLLADKLVNRIKDDMPYDTIMRGETPETVDEELLWAMFELLRKSSASAPEADYAANKDHAPDPRALAAMSPLDAQTFDIISADDIGAGPRLVPCWFDKRAYPTKPLRLTIHTVALSVMLYTPPLGAFLFTYSMLRDVAGDH